MFAVNFKVLKIKTQQSKLVNCKLYLIIKHQSTTSGSAVNLKYYGNPVTLQFENIAIRCDYTEKKKPVLINAVPTINENLESPFETLGFDIERS